MTRYRKMKWQFVWFGVSWLAGMQTSPEEKQKGCCCYCYCSVWCWTHNVSYRLVSKVLNANVATTQFTNSSRSGSRASPVWSKSPPISQFLHHTTWSLPLSPPYPNCNPLPSAPISHIVCKISGWHLRSQCWDMMLCLLTLSSTVKQQIMFPDFTMFPC